MGAFVGIVFGIVALAAAYGILHDQVTARISLEYFTIGHPMIIASQEPTLLALVWGVVATWWFALPFALTAAAITRIGRNPLPVMFTLRTAAIALLVTGVCAAVAGAMAAFQHPTIYPYWAEQIAPGRQGAFMIAAWTHLTSYAAGGLSALVALTFLIWKRVSNGAFA